jgi:hypothetical protein
MLTLKQLKYAICCILSSYFLSVMFLLLLLFQLMQPVLVCAQENPCDPDLERSAGDPLGYQRRDNRCEGRYIQKVSSQILLLASFTKSFEDYDFNSSKDLIVEWSAPGDGSIHLRAHGLRAQLFYRMDTIRSIGSIKYIWATDILAAMEISRRDMGVIGWVKRSVGKIEQDVYIPLRIQQKGNSNQSQNYQLLLLPGSELTEVYISLAPVEEDGSTGPFIRNGEALKYGYYPAERAIPIEILYLETPGIYYMEIGATLKNGGSATVEFLFYHAG